MTDIVEEESTALVTVEQPPEPVLPPIKNNAILVAKKDGVEDLRLDTDKPHFVHYEEGLFLNVKTMIGRFLIKQKVVPSFFKKLGANGYFWLERNEIPKELTAQIVSFFRRIWDEHKTEAGVILLMDRVTKEWSIFVPYQKVSGAAVKYALDPADIPDGKIVMGTMHSHCNFSPFHSGTDKHDADGMNGTHYTIGFVDRDKPEIVNMVIYNKQDFHLDKEYFNLEDGGFDHLDAAVAPIEWDEFVYPHGREMSAEVKEIFEKFAPEPVYATTTYQTWQPQYKPVTQPYPQYVPSEYGVYGNGWTEHDGWLLSDDLPDDWKRLYDHRKPETKNVGDYWEDNLRKDVIDIIFDSGLLTDEDLDNAYNNSADAQEDTFWHATFLRKLSATVTVLGKLGYVVDYSVKVKKDGVPNTPGIYDAVQDLIKHLSHELEELDDAKPQLLLPETTETSRRAKRRANRENRYTSKQRGLIS